MNIISPHLCMFFQGVNAAFDVLLICNVNVYELSQRLLRRKNPLAVSNILYTTPTPPFLVINYELSSEINVTSNTLSAKRDMKFTSLQTIKSRLQITGVCLHRCDLVFLQVSEILRTGLLTRLALMGLGGLAMLYARWRIMGTGPPAFTDVDNPASFEENVFLRVSEVF